MNSFSLVVCNEPLGEDYRDGLGFLFSWLKFHGIFDKNFIPKDHARDTV